MRLANYTIRQIEIPEVLNPESIECLMRQWFAIQPESTDVILLRGKDNLFCKGMDLQWVSNPADGSFAASMEMFITFIRQLQHAPCITIAIVDGPAMGGGVGIAAACDVVLANANSHFCLTEGMLGLIPGIILSPLLSRLSKKALSRMVFTAKKISAEEATSIGLADEFASAEEIPNLLDAWIRQVTHCKKQSVMDLKTLLSQAELHGDHLMHKGAEILKARLSNEDVRNRLLNLAYFNEA